MSRRINPTSVSVILTSAYDLVGGVDEKTGTVSLCEGYDERVKKLQDLIIMRDLNNRMSKWSFMKFLRNIKSDVFGYYNNNVNYSEHLKNHKPILSSFDALSYFMSVYYHSIADLEFKFVDISKLDGVEVGNNHIPANILVNEFKLNLLSNFSKKDRSSVLELIKTHIGHCVIEHDRYMIIRNVDLLDMINDLNMDNAPNKLIDRFLSCIPSGLTTFGKCIVSHTEFENKKGRLKNTHILKNEFGKKQDKRERGKYISTK